MTNILVGPLKRDPEFKDILSSHEILGDYAASPEVLTFNQLDLISQSENPVTSINQIIENLPMNWKPECLVLWGVDKQILPDDLDSLDCPLIAVVLNWNLAFESIMLNIDRFDWVFTDKKGEEVFKSRG